MINKFVVKFNLFLFDICAIFCQNKQEESCFSSHN
jgi:hypothetical protein